MKHKLLLVLSLLLALAACERVPAATETPPAATNTPQPLPTPTPLVDSPSEPGGVEVALTLAVIPDQKIIARVNGEEISTAAYKEELERALYSVTAQYGLDWNDSQNRSRLPAFQEQVLDQIIRRSLLQQLAKEEGITASPEEIDAEIDSIKAQIDANPSIADWESFLAQNNLTEEAARSLISEQILAQALADSHGGSRLVEQVHASHILVETEETGQEVLDKLAEGEEFSALAATYSTDPGSKEQGGDLGWFPRGMMVPEFEEAAFSLKPGETSGLVQSQFGYHIIRVHEKEEREMEPERFAQVQQQQFQAWLEAQQAEADVERLHTFQSSE